jgi:hypothetical protein
LGIDCLKVAPLVWSLVCRWPSGLLFSVKAVDSARLPGRPPTAPRSLGAACPFIVDRFSLPFRGVSSMSCCLGRPDVSPGLTERWFCFRRDFVAGDFDLLGFSTFDERTLQRTQPAGSSTNRELSVTIGRRSVLSVLFLLPASLEVPYAAGINVCRS